MQARDVDYRCGEQADRRSWASMKSLFDEVLT
jgi:hypothetical protein